MVKVMPFNRDFLGGMFEIAKQYPEDLYFSDIEDMEKYINKQIDCRVGIRNNEVIGFGFLETLNCMEDYNSGCIALYIKKGRFPVSGLQILKELISSYINSYNLFILSAVARKNNSMCIKLLKKLGFSYFTTIEKFRNNTDYIMGSIVNYGILKSA